MVTKNERDKKAKKKIKCEKYCLIDESALFIKLLDKSNNFTKYKIQFENEK